jgi:hypothetical protein
MQLQKLAAAVLVVLGLVLLLKSLAATWLLLLIVAAALALATASGVIGKWGYTAAGLCVLVAIPGFLIRAMFEGLTFALRLVKMAPIILVVIGIWWLVKKAK